LSDSMFRRLGTCRLVTTDRHGTTTSTALS